MNALRTMPGDFFRYYYVITKLKNCDKKNRTSVVSTL